MGECYQLLHSIFFTRWCGQNETRILIQVNDTFEVSHIFFLMWSRLIDLIHLISFRTKMSIWRFLYWFDICYAITYQRRIIWFDVKLFRLTLMCVRVVVGWWNASIICFWDVTCMVAFDLSFGNGWVFIVHVYFLSCHSIQKFKRWS